MKIYLAARYSRREELVGYAEELRAAGHIITSRWLRGRHEHKGPEALMPLEHRELWALENNEDILSSDCVVSFTEPEDSPYGRGGRHVEFGLALATGRRLVVVGHRENIFHCVRSVIYCPTWEEAKERIAEIAAVELGGEPCLT